MEADRIYRFLFCLFLLSISLLLLSLALGWTIPLDYLDNLLMDQNMRLVIGILSIIGILLSVLIIKKSFSKQSTNQTEVIETSLGKIKISLNALEHIVGKVAKQISGVKDTKTIIKSTPNGIAVFLQVNLAPKMHIPDTTASIQNKVHNYFTDFVGIEVEEVRVLVTKLSSEGKSRVE